MSQHAESYCRRCKASTLPVDGPGPEDHWDCSVCGDDYWAEYCRVCGGQDSTKCVAAGHAFAFRAGEMPVLVVPDEFSLEDLLACENLADVARLAGVAVLEREREVVLEEVTSALRAEEPVTSALRAEEGCPRCGAGSHPHVYPCPECRSLECQRRGYCVWCI